MPFPKGKSGNPGGRPKRDPAEIAKWVEACKGNLPILITIRNTAKKDSDKLKAIEIMEDRAWGKAIQQAELTGEDGGAIEIIKRVILNGTDAKNT